MTTPTPATITYTIPGARTLDQLNEPTVDGHPDEDARENCVAASLAEALRMLTGNQTFDGDMLKDAVYGQGYVGVQSAHAYIAYCAARGVTLAAVSAATQAGLVAAIHHAVSAGEPTLVTMPSDWNTAPADPRHPSGSTHVGLAVGVGPAAIRVMNPWHGFMQDASDAWWAARLCEGEVWTLRKAAATTTSAAKISVPAGWRDDGATLTAPNGIAVVRGIRERVLGWPGGWPAWDTPLEPERHLDQLELFNPALGGGAQQVFRASALEWTPTHGVLLMPIGAELLATRAALATAQTALTAAQSENAALRAQLAAAQTAQAPTARAGAHLRRVDASGGAQLRRSGLGAGGVADRRFDQRAESGSILEVYRTKASVHVTRALGGGQRITEQAQALGGCCGVGGHVAVEQRNVELGHRPVGGGGLAGADGQRRAVGLHGLGEQPRAPAPRPAPPGRSARRPGCSGSSPSRRGRPRGCGRCRASAVEPTTAASSSAMTSWWAVFFSAAPRDARRSWS